MMRSIRTYIASLLLTLFCCYLSGISLFSHTHIVNGSSIVHSHFGGNSEHQHSDSQYAVIDLLSNFQSEAAANHISAGAPFFLTSDICTEYIAPAKACLVHPAQYLRGPPQQ